MRSSTISSSNANALAREQSYQDYLRMMQTARVQAQRARSEAVSAFWCAVGQAFRRAFAPPSAPTRSQGCQA